MKVRIFPIHFLLVSSPGLLGSLFTATTSHASWRVHKDLSHIPSKSVSVFVSFDSSSISITIIPTRYSLLLSYYLLPLLRPDLAFLSHFISWEIQSRISASIQRKSNTENTETQNQVTLPLSSPINSSPKPKPRLDQGGPKDL